VLVSLGPEQGHPGEESGQIGPRAKRRPMKKCPFCTAQVTDETWKCPCCGEKLWDVPGLPSGKYPTGGERAFRFFAVYAALTIIGLIIGLGLFFAMARPLRERLREDREDMKRELRKTEREPGRSFVPPWGQSAPCG